MPITLSPPAGPWTVADLYQISDAGHRIEIHQGNLVIMTTTSLWHSRVARRLANALETRGREVGVRVGISRSEINVRVADVCAFRG